MANAKSSEGENRFLKLTSNLSEQTFFILLISFLIALFVVATLIVIGLGYANRPVVPVVPILRPTQMQVLPKQLNINGTIYTR